MPPAPTPPSEIDRFGTPPAGMSVNYFDTISVIRHYSDFFSVHYKESQDVPSLCLLRISTAEQTTDNQVQEIAAAGFKVTPQRIIVETVSGSVATSERPGFGLLHDKLEEGDVLVVTKLDRLGRNAMDVRTTVEALAGMGVRVSCLALGNMDLTSPAGKMTMGAINAVAEFERDLLIERTQAGLARANAEGKTLGRRPSLDEEQTRRVLSGLEGEMLSLRWRGSSKPAVRRSCV